MSLAFLLLTMAVASCSLPGSAVGKYVKKGGNFLQIEQTQDGEVTVSLSGSYHMNTCDVQTGMLKVENCEVTYIDPDSNCRIRVTLQEHTAGVEQRGNCGCGLNVNLSGVYRRHSSVPGKKAVN
jgi:hypothetical protein